MLQGPSRASVMKDSKITSYFAPLPPSTYLRILLDIHVHKLLSYSAQKRINLEAAKKEMKSTTMSMSTNIKRIPQKYTIKL